MTSIYCNKIIWLKALISNCWMLGFEFDSHYLLTLHYVQWIIIYDSCSHSLSMNASVKLTAFNYFPLSFSFSIQSDFLQNFYSFKELSIQALKMWTVRCTIRISTDAAAWKTFCRVFPQTIKLLPVLTISQFLSLEVCFDFSGRKHMALLSMNNS